MFEIVRQLIGYTGQANIDNTCLNVCACLIPIFSVVFIWFFAKLLAFVCGFSKK